jgi:hypothetical protein
MGGEEIFWLVELAGAIRASVARCVYFWSVVISNIGRL